MEWLALVLSLLPLFCFARFIRTKQERSLSSFFAEQLLELRIKQSLVPTHKSLEELSEINRRTYTLPPGLEQLWQIQESMFEAMQVFTLGPKQSDTVLYFLHGGAYVEQPSLAHWVFLTRLLRLYPCRIVVPIYPKAPDHQVEEVFALLVRHLQAFQKNRLLLAGDSAGGGLALGLAQHLLVQQSPLPEQLLLFSPWLDISLSNPSVSYLQARDPMLNKESLIEYGKAWRGATPERDPRVSPLFGPLAGLCPVTLFVGTHELFLSDARLLLSRARKEGLSIEYHEGKRMNHDYPIFPIPEAKRVRMRVAAILGGTP
ncbi:alpha/beta hydrolase [Sphaerochaeta sp.]|uniref:alpha/beta hydrolase n=1 Tax=Sphaerochaeta sp. TaxID=1972642 RepID=UPI002FC6C716